jgi:hypothetical protein
MTGGSIRPPARTSPAAAQVDFGLLSQAGCTKKALWNSVSSVHQRVRTRAHTSCIRRILIGCAVAQQHVSPASASASSIRVKAIVQQALTRRLPRKPSSDRASTRKSPRRRRKQFELCAATRMARLWLGQGKRDEARNLITRSMAGSPKASTLALGSTRPKDHLRQSAA